ncbi:MAG: O-antigen ligase family protein, partial [Clostridia bacterium]|nr:O-antigen ligase family protein [Clostridia bacterium]
MRTKNNIEDVKENNFLQSIRGKKFFYSPLFAILVCVYIYVCWITKINFYAIPFIAVLAFLILIFCKDTSPLLILLFTLIQPLRNLEVTKINIIIAGASFGLFVIGLIINMIRFRPFKKIGRLNGFLVACIFLGIAICLGGVIIPNRDLKAILPTIIFGVVVIFLSFYMFYSLGLGNEDRRAPLKLVCTAIICSSIIAALQLLFVIFSSGNPVAVISGQIELSAGYADPSYLANILGRSIPICIYLATKPKRLSFLWLWPAYVFGIFLILLSQRMSLLVAVIIAIVALICFLKNIKIHKLEWVCTFIMLVGLTFFIAAFMYKRFREMFVQLFQQSTFEQEIWAFWKRGISDYSSSPIFGVGLVPDPAASDKTFNISSGFIWYNNTIIQSFASFGILGLLSLLV